MSPGQKLDRKVCWMNKIKIWLETDEKHLTYTQNLIPVVLMSSSCNIHSPFEVVIYVTRTNVAWSNFTMTVAIWP